MADEKTAREQIDEAIAATMAPGDAGPGVANAEGEEEIHVGDTEVNDVTVDVVDAGYDVPEVHVYDLDRRHPTASVVIPPEGQGTLDLPIHAFLDGGRVEDAFAADQAPNVSDEDRAQAASEGKSARAVAEDRESKS